MKLLRLRLQSRSHHGCFSLCCRDSSDIVFKIIAFFIQTNFGQSAKFTQTDLFLIISQQSCTKITPFYLWTVAGLTPVNYVQPKTYLLSKML